MQVLSVNYVYLGGQMQSNTLFSVGCKRGTCLIVRGATPSHGRGGGSDLVRTHTHTHLDAHAWTCTHIHTRIGGSCRCIILCHCVHLYHHYTLLFNQQRRHSTTFTQESCGVCMARNTANYVKQYRNNFPLLPIFKPIIQCFKMRSIIALNPMF